MSRWLSVCDRCGQVPRPRRFAHSGLVWGNTAGGIVVPVAIPRGTHSVALRDSPVPLAFVGTMAEFQDSVKDLAGPPAGMIGSWGRQLHIGRAVEIDCQEDNYIQLACNLDSENDVLLSGTGLLGVSRPAGLYLDGDPRERTVQMFRLFSSPRATAAMVQTNILDMPVYGSRILGIACKQTAVSATLVANLQIQVKPGGGADKSTYLNAPASTAVTIANAPGSEAFYQFGETILQQSSGSTAWYQAAGEDSGGYATRLRVLLDDTSGTGTMDFDMWVIGMGTP